MYMADIHADGNLGVIWREGTWRCELGMVQEYPILRLYDGEKLELEHEVVPGTISGTAEVMRQAVHRYICGDWGARNVNSPLVEETPAVDRKGEVATICDRCRSPASCLSARRPWKDSYLCADCGRQWDVSFGSLRVH